MNHNTMKNNHIYKALFALLIVLGLASCDDRELVQVENTAAPIVMDLSAENIFLDKNYPDNPALNVSWTQAGYSTPVSINYKIEVAKDADFKTPYTLGTVAESVRTATFTVNQLNTAAQTIGLVKDVPGKMYIRVSSSLGNGVLTAVSNVTSVMVTPYALTYPTFYLVGAASYIPTPASAPGWDAAAAQILYKKDNKSIIYTYMKPANFRFLGQQAWGPTNYSIDAPGTDAASRYFKQTSTNIIFGDNENMKFTDPEGIYMLEIDADGTKQSLKATPSPLGYKYDNLYLVGSMNGWSDTNAMPMTKVSEGVFEITTAVATDAEFKFLGQKSWDGALEWGHILKDNNGNSGFLGPKGDNSNIVYKGAGGNKITVNLKAGTYTIQ